MNKEIAVGRAWGSGVEVVAAAWRENGQQQAVHAAEAAADDTAVAVRNIYSFKISNDSLRSVLPAKA